MVCRRRTPYHTRLRGHGMVRGAHPNERISARDCPTSTPTSSSRTRLQLRNPRSADQGPATSSRCQRRQAHSQPATASSPAARSRFHRFKPRAAATTPSTYMKTPTRYRALMATMPIPASVRRAAPARQPVPSPTSRTCRRPPPRVPETEQSTSTLLLGTSRPPRRRIVHLRHRRL